MIDSWEGSVVNDLFATGGYEDGSVLRLWQASSGTLRQSIELPAWPVNVSVARDGSRVGALLEDGTIHIYDAASGQTVDVPSVSSEKGVLRMSGAGHYALILQDGHDEVWNLDAGKAVLTVPDEATALTFTLDDRFAVWSTPQGLRSVALGSGQPGPVVDGAMWKGSSLWTSVHPGEVLLYTPPSATGASRQVFRWIVDGQHAPSPVQTLNPLPVNAVGSVGSDDLLIRVPHCDLATLP